MLRRTRDGGLHVGQILVAGLFGGDMGGRFIPVLLASPTFYLQWQTKAAAVAGGIGIMLGLLDLFLVQRRGARAFLLGIWSAYLLFGFIFNFSKSLLRKQLQTPKRN